MSDDPPLKRIIQGHKHLANIEGNLLGSMELTKAAQSSNLTLDVRSRLEGVLSSLEQLGKLQEECIAEISTLLQVPSGMAVVKHSPSDINRLPATIIPQMRTVTWDDFHRSFGSSQYTIDILDTETASHASEISGSDQELPLPERIRINSSRLIYTIKSNFFTSTEKEPTRSNRPFVILRPFKQLVYHKYNLKALVDELEVELQAHKADPNPSFANVERLKKHHEALNLASFDDLALYAKELGCLLEFMEDSIEPVQKRVETESDIVSFSELWFLYPENTYLFIKGVGSAQKVWRVIQRTGGREEEFPAGSNPHKERLSAYRDANFVVDCYFIDYNGAHFLPAYDQFEIQPFEGIKAVNSLPIIPLRIAVKNGLVDEDEIVSRGDLFIKYCTGTHHLYYSGRSHHRDCNGKFMQGHVDTKIDSEVILDFERAVANNPSLVEYKTEASVYQLSDEDLSDEYLEIGNDAIWDKLVSDRVRLKISAVASGDLLAASDRGYLPILPDRVFGYVLKNRTWGRFLSRLTLDH